MDSAPLSFVVGGLMLGFVGNFVPHRGNPIGIDLGARTLRLAQIEPGESELKMIHADAIDVPATADENAEAYRAFAVKAVRESLRSGKFHGRRVAIALPQSSMQVKHVRIERRNEGDLAAQIMERAAAALEANTAELLIRNVCAGEVAGESGAQQEYVLFATQRAAVEDLLAAFTAANIEVVGVQVQPRILAQGFGNFHRRKLDADAVNLFVDLGGDATRAIVADPTALRFVRSTTPGVDEIHQKIAASLGMSLSAVADLRRATIAAQVVRSHDLPVESTTITDARDALERATAVESQRLADELDLCRRYYDATFPQRPVTRLVFVGGGARDRLLCAAVAQAMSMPAQIGDPLVRFNRSALPSLGCLDRREPQPAWAVAIGLSLLGQAAALV